MTDLEYCMHVFEKSKSSEDINQNKKYNDENKFK